MIPSDIVPFAGIAALLAVTPGPDMATVTKSALRGGRPAAILTTLGIACALALYVTAASLGLAAILRAAGPLFSLVRLAGAGYLIYLGAQALMGTFRDQDKDIQNEPLPATGFSGPLRQGFLSAALNPKLLVLFSTLLPQFVDSGRPVLPQMFILGLLFSLIGLVWLTLYGLLVTAMRDFFASRRVRNSMERFTGAVLIGLGARLALEKL
jgi:threonine/homoserine/homoserine lactone efflux protein